MQSTRTAIISDIHGNLAGLEAVWRDIESSACDGVVCLGDLVDGGDENDEVVRFVRDRGIPTVRGNHDDINSLALASDVVEYLQGLPWTIEDGDILYVHISPRKCERKIVDVYEAWNVFDECTARLVVVGHAHIPMVFGERSPHSATSMEYAVRYNEPMPIDPTDRYIVCVGAVGYPRDGIRYPRYALLDQGANTIEMRVVDGPVLPYG